MTGCETKKLEMKRQTKNVTPAAPTTTKITAAVTTAKVTTTETTATTTTAKTTTTTTATNNTNTNTTTTHANLIAQPTQDWRVGSQAWLHAPFHHLLELQKRLFKGAPSRRLPQEKGVVVFAGLETGSLHVGQQAHALRNLRVVRQCERVAGLVSRNVPVTRTLLAAGGVRIRRMRTLFLPTGEHGRAVGDSGQRA